MVKGRTPVLTNDCIINDVSEQGREFTLLSTIQSCQASKDLSIAPEILIDFAMFTLEECFDGYLKDNRDPTQQKCRNRMAGLSVDQFLSRNFGRMEIGLLKRTHLGAEIGPTWFMYDDWGFGRLFVVFGGSRVGVSPVCWTVSFVSPFVSSTL